MKTKTWENYVLDVTLRPPVYCPIEDDGTVIIGMNYVTPCECPGKLVAVVHMDGQEAVEAWCAANPCWRDEFHNSK
jgi:hypothetical protein